jgi:hypothetical protein
LACSDFASHIKSAAGISDGTLMAWIDWDAVIAALAEFRVVKPPGLPPYVSLSVL